MVELTDSDAPKEASSADEGCGRAIAPPSVVLCGVVFEEPTRDALPCSVVRLVTLVLDCTEDPGPTEGGTSAIPVNPKPATAR